MKLVVDASALLAVLLDEPDASQYLSKLLLAEKIWISPVNWWEVQVRMRALYGEPGELVATRWMGEVGVVVEPVTLAQAELALGAFARYRGKPAKLNMGDCFAYGLAQAKGAPLLYKGNDFSKTDLRNS